METTTHQKLAVEKIPRLVMDYAFTTLTSLVLYSAYSLIDSLFVSWGVGDDAMGGISIVLPFVLLQSAIATALGGGAASIISRKLGEDRLDQAGNVAFNAMLTFWITAILTTALSFALMNPLLNLMGVTEELAVHAREYFNIILIGNLFSTGFSSIIRAEGKMRYALLIWVIPIVVNIILDAVFILLLGWGVKGSGLATVLSQFTSFSMSILFFTKYSTLNFKGVRLQIPAIKEIFAIGLPALLQSLIPSLSLLLMNNILKLSSGTQAINTFAYINKILMFGTIPFVAIMQAISPIIGYNHGAKNDARVRETVRFSILIATGYAILVLVVLEIFPRLFLMAFTNNPEILDFGAQAVRILAISIPFTPLSSIIGASYLAKGDKLKAMLMFSLDFLFLVPSAIFLSRTAGINGAWWGYVLAKILATAFVAGWLALQKKKTDKKIAS